MAFDLSTKICGKVLKNPLVLAAGFLGTNAELLTRVAKNGAAAVTTKSCTLLPRKGHENPTVLAIECGIINAVGLANPGVDQTIFEIQKLKKMLKGEALIIASIAGGTLKEFGLLTKKISIAQPDFIEVNISCPNTELEFGRPFGADKKDAAHVTRIVRKNTQIPIIVKLSPNVTDIKEIARSVEEAGADAISAINTLVGMVIDIDAGKPVLTNKRGGISGPGIKPIALRCVFDIAEVVKIPIIGLGGVTNGQDVITMMMAGASAVGIGTGIHYRGMSIFKKVVKEIKDYMHKNGYHSLSDFRGVAHES